MKVILLQKVDGCGQADEVKEVADGYARNFLFPRHLAVLASPQAVRDLELRTRRLARDAEKDLHEQQRLAEQVDGLEIEFKVKVSSKGLLYAAVGAEQIAKELQGKKFMVTKNQIHLAPIKEPGAYPAKIKFRHGLEAEVTVIVSVESR